MGGSAHSPAAAPPLTPLAAGYLPDEEALRGTRFEFGGRKPYSFQPRRPAPDAAPPPAYPAAAQRPLPGIGTVALGKVVRTAPYGAFVDFLGFRGLIHISQLLPGYRVEQVEDVVQNGDEVVVRVIAIDPERRHINLALVPTAPGVTHPTGAPPVARSETPASRPPSPLPPIAGPPPPAEPAPPLPPAPAQPPVQAQQSPQASQSEAAVRTPQQAPPARPRVTQPPSPANAAQPGSTARPASPARPGPASAPSAPPTRPAAPPSRPAPATPETATAPVVARHGARAVRRDVAEPSHPMARLLAAAGETALSPVEKDRVHPEAEASAAARSDVAPPASPGSVSVPFERPVHEAAPEPEPDDQPPATLEALAARFSHRKDKPDKASVPPNKPDRSRQEREKQAAILARLRGESQ